MRTLPTMLSKMPLFPRVVSLHIVGWILLFVSLQVWPLQITPTFASTLPHKQTAKVRLSAVGQPIIMGMPASFRVDRLGINLPVINGTYDEKTAQWTLSDNSVQFADMTIEPNDRAGNTLIYGHNTWQVLAPMAAIVAGDIATITTTNNHTFSYVYVSDAVVQPEVTSVLYDNPDTPRLTVMTCDGIWSQTRRLMYFDLQGVS